MAEFESIEYLGFWDFPRIFLFHHEGKHFLFDCEFDDVLEDDRDYFKVYLMPELSESDKAGSWVPLHKRAIGFLGTIPNESVHFDETKRKFVDACVLELLDEQIVATF